MKNALKILALLALAPLLVACPPTSHPPLTGSGMDMFAPTTLRVHPLSRLITPPANPELEARLEFTDQMGDITKGVGTVTFDLFPYALASLDNKGPRIASFTSDITTPDQNKLHWDPITRTYLFHLELPKTVPLAPNNKFVVTATVTLPNSTRLQDDLTLTVK